MIRRLDRESNELQAPPVLAARCTEARGRGKDEYR